MLTQMVNAIAHTRSLQWLQASVALLDQEYNWFSLQHTLPNLNLSRYLPFDAAPLPRPESYREDEAVVAGMPPTLRNFTLGAIIGGAESGWDFSSRWIKNNGGSLGDIETQNVVPVCLNSILYSNEIILADLHAKLARHAESSSSSSSSSNHLHHILASQSYARLALQRAAAMRSLLWSPPPLSRWHDSCATPPCPPPAPSYISSIMPLWAGLGIPGGSAAAVVDFVNSLLHDGGVATSTVDSGLQWDGNNVWPPLQFFTSAALRSLADPSATTVAVKVERTYLRAASCSWQANGTLFEKYSAAVNGASGGGGEYVAQTGFGWSAGVAVAFILADLQSSPSSAAQQCSDGAAAGGWVCLSSAAQAGVIASSVLAGVALFGVACAWVVRRRRLGEETQPLLKEGQRSR
jgi:alpha,alpha-trehalase